MTREDAALLRAQASRAVVHALDDAPAQQRLVVETHEGVLRSEVEVLQPYGLAAAPAPGGMTVVLAIGGDPSDLVALPVAGGGRLGGLDPGEVALHDDAGNRVHLRAGGTVEVRGATAIRLQVGGTVLTVTSAGVTLQGNLHVVGNITATGTITP